MAAETLSRACELVLATEGGFVDNPKDPGGATCKGVTLTTFSAWRKKACSVNELQLLTDNEAADIFTAQYALPVRYNDLPAGVDYAVFDASVNSGPGRAAKLLQSALGFAKADIDGIIGAKTMAAIKVADPVDLIGRYNIERLNFMQTLRIWSTFGKGWTSRVEAVGIQAQAFALGGVPSSATSIASAPGKATGATKVLSSANGKAAVIAISGACITAGGLATQLTTALQPFNGIKPIGYALVGLSIITSAVPLWASIRRAASGEAAA